MRFNICTNLTNGAGLERDYKLLRGMLESMGHSVQGVMFTDQAQPRQADVNIFLEVVMPVGALGRATENWLIPNSEWWYDSAWNQHLAKFNKVLCKTQDCFRIWEKKVGKEKCRYIGFESHDFYNPNVVRKQQFLHMAGKSETKNTAAVVEAWRKYQLPYPLTVVAFKPDIIKHCLNVPNVRHIVRLTDEQVAHAMNESLFHVMPSKYEGFGHYIHEALGCGGIVLTTDAPPMNEFRGIDKAMLIEVSNREVCRAATFNLVDPLHVAGAVRRAAVLSEADIRDKASMARAMFLEDKEAFKKAFAEVVNGR